MDNLDSYGVLDSENAATEISRHVERIKRRGWSIIENTIDFEFIEKLKRSADSAFEKYESHFGKQFLTELDEHNGIRMPFYIDKIFLELAKNETVLHIVEELMGCRFVLNQQNYISNPPKAKYNQGKWHRDMPYAHFTSSRPLMINALFALDDFTLENGATRALPGSHLFERFPSASYVTENEVVVEAKAGSFIIIDSMLYHSGSHNKTRLPRRAVNNVYANPHIRQQIRFTFDNTKHLNLNSFEEKLLGLDLLSADSVQSFLNSRSRK